MTLSEAQLEFAIRYYRWSISEAEQEVEEVFPVFCFFKGGTSWQTYQFMRQLDKRDQLLFVHGYLRSSHPMASKVLGHVVSEEHKAVLARYDRFSSLQPRPELELRARREAGEKIAFVSKAKIQAAVISQFKMAFGDRCTEYHELKGDRFSIFKLTIREWVIHTSFWYGNSESCIDYCHGIFSADQARQFDPAVAPPAIVLIRSFCWINLSIMKWVHLLPEDLEPTINVVIGLCQSVFGALPQLLSGLERSTVMSD